MGAEVQSSSGLRNLSSEKSAHTDSGNEFISNCRCLVIDSRNKTREGASQAPSLVLDVNKPLLNGFIC